MKYYYQIILLNHNIDIEIINEKIVITVFEKLSSTS